MSISGTFSPAQSRQPGSAHESRGDLPAQLTSFIGREREIAAVGTLLESARLLTLTGSGGAGKTRLAVEIARRSSPRKVWIELAPLRDPALVAQEVAGALGMREEAGRVAQDILLERLADEELILILDSCEHLVDATAELVDSLLRRCPGVRVLATSREALGVAGEQAWLVPPLSISADSVAESEAGRLFAERARAVLPSFAIDQQNADAVAHICRRLDGIPLAIELAAARVRVLAPEQIAARLDDSFRLLSGGRQGASRHRTLREAIDWSFQLLSEPEAALFRRLAVFEGTLSLDAVEAICPGIPVDDAEVLDLVSALVDKSLVTMETQAGEARFRLLETVRQYAREKLVAAGEESALRRKHAEFFVELALVSERPTFGGASDPSWTRRLTAEEDNLRAAADWTEQDPAGADASLRTVSAMHWHWFARGHFREGRRRAETAMKRADQATPLARAKGQTAAATLAFWLGEYDRIEAPARAAVETLRTLDDSWSLCYALTTFGIGQSMTDAAGAEAPLAEAVAIARADSSVLRIFALYWQARVAFGRGEVERAHGLFAECLGVAREMGASTGIAHSLTMLGIVEAERGNAAPARTHLSEALGIHTAAGDVLGTIWSLEGMAGLAMSQRQTERAARLLAAIRTERARIGVPWADRELPRFEGFIDEVRQQLGTFLFSMAWSAGSRMSLAEAARHAVTDEQGCAPRPEPEEPPRALTTTGELRLPGSLQVQALGPLRIVLDRRPLERDAWSSAKPRELLLFLLIHPDGVTRENVGLAFWPEASTEQVRNNFHVTLHRLRKTLGDPRWIRLEGNHYQIDPDAVVELDALAFERDLPAAILALKTGNPAPLEAVLARYRGDFLEQETVGDWHLELRDRLRRLHTDALDAAGEFWTAKKEWNRAAEVYRRLVTADQLHEPAYRALMTSLSEAGDRPEALRVYGRLQQVLKKELEADPERETAALYQRLKAL